MHSSNRALASNSKSRNSFEGYITLKQQVFADADEYGNPINLILDKNNLASAQERKLYISEYLVIDIMEMNHFVDGKCSKTDTVGWIFYDLNRQKYIKFDSLSINAKVMKKKGAMNVKGAMNEKGGGFSNRREVDPFNDVNDSLVEVVVDTVKEMPFKLVTFKVRNEIEAEEYKQYTLRAKFWSDSRIKNFPLQISYILSRKLKNEFVFKMQLPMPDGKSVMVTEFDYQPAKLPDMMKNIFKEWEKQIEND